MLESLAAWVLRTYVGEYVENLNTDQLSIGYGKEDQIINFENCFGTLQSRIASERDVNYNSTAVDLFAKCTT